MIIAFDLDGTLIDSARDLGEAASELVQAYGAPPLSVAQVVTMVGDGAPVLVRRALEQSGLDPETPGALDRFLKIYDRRLMDHTVAYPGIHEELGRAMRRGPLAVLTNKPLGPAIGLLEALGLRGFFTRVIGGDGEYGRKPDLDLTAIELGIGQCRGSRNSFLEHRGNHLRGQVGASALAREFSARIRQGMVGKRQQQRNEKGR